MKLGYARVSTDDQNLHLQLDALEAAGCDDVFKEKVSGAKTDRPQLDVLLAKARKGDVIVVYKLDRLGRSLGHLVALVHDLMAKGIGLKSLSDPFDTTTAQGKLIFNIFASLAEFERELIVERTKAGLKAARARGRLGGRPKGLSPALKRKAPAVAALYRAGDMTVTQICENQGISRASFYKCLRAEGVEVASPNAGKAA